jgi:Zn-dependent M28 family amino/carboxypeptidase
MANTILGEKKIEKAIKKIDKKGSPFSFTNDYPLAFTIQRIEQPVYTENVLGYIEGSDLKEEVIVVTAHYDHIGIDGEEVYNGADDDGSGTVALLEIAQAMSIAKSEGNGPRRSIVIMGFSGEEKGLLGSEYYSNNPVFELEQTVANLNIDMIGRIDEDHQDDPNYVYVIGSDFLSTELHEINQYNAANYSDLKLDYRYNSTDDPNRFYYRSDHYNFAKHNIPVIFYFNGTHEDYHQATDEVDKIEYDLLAKRAQLVFQDLWTLANRDKRIVVDKTMEN